MEMAHIEAAAQSLLNLGQAVAVLSMHAPAINQVGCRWLMMPVDPQEYGQVLYARLREVDTWGCRCVLVQLPSAIMAWEAVRDRLQRAAGGRQDGRACA
jgi:L-threonylcarbamoyladenylate synthase